MGVRKAPRLFQKWNLTPIARDLRARETPQESALWERIRAQRFEGLKFRRQHQVGHYVVDFYCAEKGWVLELDGSQHLEPANAILDRERDEKIKALGLRIFRFSNLDHPENILTVLRMALDGEPPSP